MDDTVALRVGGEVHTRACLWFTRCSAVGMNEEGETTGHQIPLPAPM